MNKTAVIKSFEDFHSLRDDWNSLVANQAPSKIWLTHDWYDCWWRSFGGSQRLYIVTVHRDGRLVAIAPLMIQELKIKGVRQRVLSFIENGLSPRSQLIVDKSADNVIDAMWDELRSRKGEWDLARFKNFEAIDELEQFREYMSKRGIKYVQQDDRQSPFIDLSSGWNQVQEGFGKWLRRNLRRGQKRLSRDAELGFEVIRETADLRRGLDICFDISDRSWKGEEGVAMAGRKARAEFFQRLVENPLIAESVRMYLLKQNSAYIAFELMLEYGGHGLALAADYDLEHRKNSPGSILKSFILEHQIENGIRVYDFDGTLYDYKMYWTDRVRPHFELWIFHSGFKSRFMYLAKKWFSSRADAGN